MERIQQDSITAHNLWKLLTGIIRRYGTSHDTNNKSHSEALNIELNCASFQLTNRLPSISHMAQEFSMKIKVSLRGQTV